MELDGGVTEHQQALNCHCHLVVLPCAELGCRRHPLGACLCCWNISLVAFFAFLRRSLWVLRWPVCLGVTVMTGEGHGVM